MTTTIRIGDTAPDFKLKDTDGNEVSLSALRGCTVVILFFPLAFTGVCTKELCHVRDTLSDYQTLQAQVLGVSVDSFFTLNQFKKQQGLNYPLLSDFNKEAATAYGCLYEEFFGYKGVAKRSAFIVDREGIIRYAEVLEKAGDLPDFDSIRTTLARLGRA